MKIKIYITKKFMLILSIILLLVAGVTAYFYDSKELRYDNTNASILASTTDEQITSDYLYSREVIYKLTIENPNFHNSIFRGKDVTEYMTSEYSLYDRIADGTFTDLYVGDYVVANEIIWRIAGFDIYYGKGEVSNDTNQAGYNHHAVIVPDTNLIFDKMNTSNITSGGYVGSYMYNTVLPLVLSTYITPVFGNHVLTYYTRLTQSVNTSPYNRYGTNTGATNNRWALVSRKIDLMNENQVFGSVIWSSSGYEVGTDNVQFPLFRLKSEFIDNQQSSYWLRTIVKSTQFASVEHSYSNSKDASNLAGVRPYFYIG